MKVSVIIPSYKPGDYLWGCLDSLVGQSLLKEYFEVLLILNGCNEPYHSMLRNYRHEHQDLQLYVIQTDISGVSNARNIGIDNARGEYLTFIDDDDFVSPDYLEELYNHANKNTIPVCRPLSFIDGTEDYQDYNITKDYDKYSNRIRVPFYKARRFFNGPVYKLIHRSIIGDRRFDPRFSHGEDSLFMFLISDKIEYVEFADKTAIYYRRIRPNSATQTKKTLYFVLSNYTKLIVIQTLIYIRGFPHYNFLFFINTILGRLKSILLG